MLPEFSAVAKCCGCKRFYWVDEAEVKGQVPAFGEPEDVPEDVPEDWKRAEPVKHLTIEEYIEALDAGVGTGKKKERYLRLHLWWAVNDIVRRNATARIPTRYLKKLHENLSKLSALLTERDPNQRILKAEIAREMGDFAKAVSLLEGLPSEFRWVADRIKTLSEEKNSLVTKLTPD